MPKETDGEQIDDGKIKVLAQAEMTIVPTGSETIIDDEGKHADAIVNVIQGTLWSAAVFSGLHYLLNGEEVSLPASFVLRSGVAIKLGTMIFHVTQDLSSRVDTFGLRSHIKDSDYKQIGFQFAKTSIATLGFLSVGLPLITTFKDSFETNALLERVEVSQEKLLAYQEDPSQHSRLREMLLDFQKDIISSVDEDGELTSEALAKMLIYFDGGRVDFSPQDFELNNFEQDWTFELNGQSWDVGYYSPEHWVVEGENSSWMIGDELDGKTIHEAFETQVQTEQDQRLKVVIEASGLIDGRSAFEDILQIAGHISAVPDLNEDIGYFNCLFPYEWNEYWRRDLSENVESHYASFDKALMVTLEDAHNQVLNSTYQNTLSQINQD